jgi:hypothetical protein
MIFMLVEIGGVKKFQKERTLLRWRQFNPV